MMSDRPPTVSVVIPAYNAAAFIETTLDSVRAQTYRDYEVVVVDDGSADATQRVVEQYLYRNNMPGRCIRQENKGIAGGRNTGMQVARGEFIALLDHDDHWYPQKLDIVMAEFDRRPGTDLICHEENIVRKGQILRKTSRSSAGIGTYEGLLFRGNPLSPSATVYKRDKALSIGGFRERKDFDTAEDYDFWMRFSRIARFHFIAQILGEYHIRESAASGRIEYHHSNLENVLQQHFVGYLGNSPDLISRLRRRRRISAVYRSAASQLMTYGGAAEAQRRYVVRMLRAFPFEPKNLARFVMWAIYRYHPSPTKPSAVR